MYCKLIFLLFPANCGRSHGTQHDMTITGTPSGAAAAGAGMHGHKAGLLLAVCCMKKERTTRSSGGVT
jgi:hypothetical protein